MFASEVSSKVNSVKIGSERFKFAFASRVLFVRESDVATFIAFLVLLSRKTTEISNRRHPYKFWGIIWEFSEAKRREQLKINN